jgi:hypothetical protein
MALDPALEDALQRAVAEAGESKQVAQRLIAWLKALSNGESSEEQNLSFYDNVMSAIAPAEASRAD